MEVVGETENSGNTTTIICNNYLHYHAGNQYVVTAERKRSLQKIDDLDLIERAVCSADETIVATAQPNRQVSTKTTPRVKLLSDILPDWH
jgi:hypothetical protein